MSTCSNGEHDTPVPSRVSRRSNDARKIAKHFTKKAAAENNLNTFSQKVDVLSAIEPNRKLFGIKSATQKNIHLSNQVIEIKHSGYEKLEATTLKFVTNLIIAAIKTFIVTLTLVTTAYPLTSGSTNKLTFGDISGTPHNRPLQVVNVDEMFKELQPGKIPHERESTWKATSSSAGTHLPPAHARKCSLENQTKHSKAADLLQKVNDLIFFSWTGWSACQLETCTRTRRRFCASRRWCEETELLEEKACSRKSKEGTCC
ncbi:hypothetical protein HELRODRAFT_171814 [Helobdella robusta]|uniref:Uncharacterized protein n=1 Tax=Helobdella robusta TaxID=6412 RepID=T1F4Q5_HELRO|nr:hypothetical protein HELRODRAFT_171814 [Helobdella robusta]ESO05415.1 hypothetical protein HELRODRAFT_171814 [Helobdella robusta]